MNLDAIRARDAEWGSLDRPGAGLTFAPTPQVVRDRRTLLAEVDRLTAMHPYGSRQEVGAAFAVMDERARISEGVRGLPPYRFADHYLGGAVDRDAVRNIVEGEG